MTFQIVATGDGSVAVLGDHGWVGNRTLFGAGLGNDSSEDGFGAVRFEAEDPTRSSWHRGFEQHEHDFDAGSESLYNIGRVVDGSGHVNAAGHTSDPFWDPPRILSGTEIRPRTSPDGLIPTIRMQKSDSTVFGGGSHGAAHGWLRGRARP